MTDEKERSIMEEIVMLERFLERCEESSEWRSRIESRLAWVRDKLREFRKT